MTKNFSKLRKETDTQIQETQRVSTKMNLKRPTQRHIIIKLSKVKDRENLISSKRKATCYIQGNHHMTISTKKEN